MSGKLNLVPNPSQIEPVNISDPKFKANPFPYYARLRAEAPVFPVTVRGKQRAWLITRYDDVVNVLKDERFLKNRRNAMTPEQLKKSPWLPPMFKAVERNLLGVDKPDHTRLRALVHKAFTPRMIENMRGSIQELTDELITKAERKGRMDILADLALPLPLIVIGRIMGLPPEDNDKFHRMWRVFISIGNNPNMLTVIPTVLRLISYLRKLIRTRAKSPQDDLITALVQAKEGDDKLTEDEILAMILILLSAGHETTVNLIGNGTLALLDNPDQFAKLRNEPELGKSAVEELLRFGCPVEMTSERYASSDIEVAGTVIPRGEMVLCVIGSADRDANHFENPDQLDITRQSNKHLSFGQGIHYCVGAPLARMEGQIALTTLVQRLPNLRLAVPREQLQWRGGMIVRGLETLPVTF